MRKLPIIIISALTALLVLSSCAEKASEPVDKPQEDVPQVTTSEPSTEATTEATTTETTTEATTEATTTVTTTETTPETTTAATTTAVPETTPAPTTAVSETTPAPTTASIAVEPASGKMYAVNSVNVRSGPGTGYDRLGHLDKAEDADITGVCENGWYRIKFKGGDGFVSGKYLSKDKPIEVTTTVTTAATTAPETKPSESKTSSSEKPDASGKTAAEISEEFMSKVKTVMNCPQKFESDWVPNEPHHPTKNGKLKRITYYSSTCKVNRTARVFISDQLDMSGKEKYPVLYILHGYWGHDNSMAEDEGCQNIIGKMIKAGECEKMIVVFPDIFASPDGKPMEGGMTDFNNKSYDNCLNDITKDLMPYIESNYPCKTGRDNTAIFGFSMGGREAIAMGFKHPEKFGYIGASCPAPGVQDVVPESKMYYKEGYEPYLFMICAAGDDQMVWTTPQSYHDIFTKHKLTHVWWVVDKSWHGGPANHSMAYNFAKYAFKAK